MKRHKTTYTGVLLLAMSAAAVLLPSTAAQANENNFTRALDSAKIEVVALPAFDDLRTVKNLQKKANDASRDAKTQARKGKTWKRERVQNFRKRTNKNLSSVLQAIRSRKARRVEAVSTSARLLAGDLFQAALGEHNEKVRIAQRLYDADERAILAEYNTTLEGVNNTHKNRLKTVRNKYKKEMKSAGKRFRKKVRQAKGNMRKVRRAERAYAKSEQKISARKEKRTADAASARKAALIDARTQRDEALGVASAELDEARDTAFSEYGTDLERATERVNAQQKAELGAVNRSATQETAKRRALRESIRRSLTRLNGGKNPGSFQPGNKTRDYVGIPVAPPVEITPGDSCYADTEILEFDLDQLREDLSTSRGADKRQIKQEIADLRSQSSCSVEIDENIEGQIEILPGADDLEAEFDAEPLPEDDELPSW